MCVALISLGFFFKMIKWIMESKLKVLINVRLLCTNIVSGFHKQVERQQLDYPTIIITCEMKQNSRNKAIQIGKGLESR